MSKLLWFFWLALLQSAFGFAIPNKVAFSAPHSTKIIRFCTITYDEQNPAKNVYDVVGLADFRYDSARCSPQTTRKIEPWERVAFLPDSPNFLPQIVQRLRLFIVR